MSDMQTISLERIRPREDQPRQFFDERGLLELAASIKANGFLGHITVRRVNGYYELLAGHRRRLAALKVGLTELPCCVEDIDDSAARVFVLLDNLNRADIQPWEEGQAYQELIDLNGLSVEQVAAQAGKCLSHVRTRMRIAKEAGDEARRAYLEGDLSLATLNTVTRLPNKVLSPVRCQACGAINNETRQVCAVCGTDLPEVRYPSGNPQTVAVGKARGKSIQEVEKIVDRIKECYCLGEKPVQTMLTIDAKIQSEEVIAAKGEWERHMERVGKLSEWANENGKLLAKLTGEQLEAIKAQAYAAELALRHIQVQLIEEQQERSKA